MLLHYLFVIKAASILGSFDGVEERMHIPDNNHWPFSIVEDHSHEENFYFFYDKGILRKDCNLIMWCIQFDIAALLHILSIEGLFCGKADRVLHITDIIPLNEILFKCFMCNFRLN
ncbi:uncharacterized protein LOC119649579 [Hermetia illucens]|uniref:uncharacterized protein LOC119649579 n=1 Tax=Hermetia illucens TaxID=343691 RepID=UPI0018CC4480|nr:uncharacterized protein LOC119649579 [Hermetia illucens]